MHRSVSANKEKIAPIIDLRDQSKGKKIAVIGDVHGCYDELDELLDRIDWSSHKYITILTGDLVDRGPKIKETLQFAIDTPNLYSLMSNHEWKLLRYLRGHQVQKHTLAKTIEQCGEEFLRNPHFLSWLESLPYIIRFAADSYVVHAGIRPDRPIYQQNKNHCLYIRTWNPKTGSVKNEGVDPWWFEYPYSNRRYGQQKQIKIFFGHQRHDKAWVSPWACALDGGVVFGGALRSYVDGRGVEEVKAKQMYEMQDEALV